MEIVALFVAALLQLAVLVVEQLRETVDAIKTALTNQYVEAAEGTRLAELLDDELNRGAFAGSDADGFAAGVQRLLQAQSRDRHLLMWHGPPGKILTLVGGRLQGPAIGRTERRPDGVGHVEVRHSLNESQGNAAIAAQIDGRCVPSPARRCSCSICG
jgi:hypothetical protein